HCFSPAHFLSPPQLFSMTTFVELPLGAAVERPGQQPAVANVPAQSAASDVARSAPNTVVLIVCPPGTSGVPVPASSCTGRPGNAPGRSPRADGPRAGPSSGPARSPGACP